MISQTPLEASSVPTTDTLIEKVHQLSPTQQQEALTFIEFLLHRDQPRQTIWDKIEERIAKLPEDAIAELPSDSSENLDHYLYGVSKE
ncbi:hypothetical protein C7H19_12280 [Aphanothece hegewaldii CCALA 016]|uniref:DUF2281 domain-containing protein n=1 Tax=Aphanothece hegewaldii CCALA 016 TaxID=2107694 RepID=A0A2T1LX24_9CHRO|nr:hypothetical protein [Aphanothece hegewaldii]PSF36740.1 hypothetical protein C7H19_12280 [Aphanothece hegewaldii CCALA 016]